MKFFFVLYLFFFLASIIPLTSLLSLLSLVHLTGSYGMSPAHSSNLVTCNERLGNLISPRGRGEEVFSMVAFTEGLYLKGVSFSGFRYMKG